MFAFDALENVQYQILANYEYLMYAEAYICSPDGNSECLDYWMWQWGMSFGWTPEVSGRYFIVFEPMGEFEYQIDPGQITILITSEQPNYLADIANQKGIGAKDGVVDYLDLMALSEFWLGDFGANQWAAFADIDSSMDINLEDLSVLAGPWLNSMQE